VVMVFAAMVLSFPVYFCSSEPPRKSQRKERPAGRGQEFGAEHGGVTAGKPQARASIKKRPQGAALRRSPARWHEPMQGACARSSAAARERLSSDGRLRKSKDRKGAAASTVFTTTARACLAGGEQMARALCLAFARGLINI